MNMLTKEYRMIVEPNDDHQKIKDLEDKVDQLINQVNYLTYRDRYAHSHDDYGDYESIDIEYPVEVDLTDGDPNTDPEQDMRDMIEDIQKENGENVIQFARKEIE